MPFYAVKYAVYRFFVKYAIACSPITGIPSIWSIIGMIMIYTKK